MREERISTPAALAALGICAVIGLVGVVFTSNIQATSGVVVNPDKLKTHMAMIGMAGLMLGMFIMGFGIYMEEREKEQGSAEPENPLDDILAQAKEDMRKIANRAEKRMDKKVGKQVRRAFRIE